MQTTTNISHSNSSDILKEISIHSREFKEIKTLLTQEQKSLVAYYFIDNFIRWLSFPFYKFDEDEYWSDAARMKIYCPEGKVDYGIIITIVEYKNGRMFVMLYCTESANYFIVKDILMSTTVLDWTKCLNFEGVQEGLVPIIKEVLFLKQINITRMYEKEMLAMPTSLALQIELECPPEDIYVDRIQLKKTHIDLVNDHWEEKGEDSTFLVEALIRNSRDAAVYLRSGPNLLPRVWALRQHYGGIGMINTTNNQQCRERDFLQLLIRYMSKTVTMVRFAPLSEDVVLKKMDFNNIQDIFSTLKQDWPHSIHTYFFLLNFMDWTENSVNVDFEFYCPDGDATIGSVLAAATFKGGDTFISYHCVDYISCKAIHDCLRTTDIIDWDRPPIFESIHERLVPELKQIVSKKGGKIIKEDICYQMWMPPDIASRVMVELQPELYFYPLDANQTDLINENWSFAGPGTDLIVKETLSNNGGLGIIFHGNETFAGWAVEQHYGGIGMLFVFPEFRRKGYARELIKGMISRLVFRQIDPFALVEIHNNQSRLLLESLNFQHICVVHWIRLQRN